MPDLLARTLALDLARSKIGTLERYNNLVEFNVWYYGRDQSAAWCGTFASWCTFNAGAPCPATTSKGFAYVPAGVAWAKANGLWKPVHTYSPRPADLEVFSFEGQRPDHVELFESADAQGRSINIGGNTIRPGATGSEREGGGVWRRVRQSALIGYIVPPYPQDNQPVPTPIEEIDMEFFIIRFGDAPGTGDDNPGRWAWFPAINRKTFISGDAIRGFQGNKFCGGELLFLEAEVKGIKNLGDA